MSTVSLAPYSYTLNSFSASCHSSRQSTASAIYSSLIGKSASSKVHPYCLRYAGDPFASSAFVPGSVVCSTSPTPAVAAFLWRPLFLPCPVFVFSDGTAITRRHETEHFTAILTSAGVEGMFLSNRFPDRYFYVRPRRFRLVAQNSRSQSKLSCPTEAKRKLPVSSYFIPKVKTMLKLLWTLLKANLRILGLIGRGTTYFVQNKTTIILPGDTRRTYGRVAMPDEGDKCFGAKLEA